MLRPQRLPTSPAAAAQSREPALEERAHRREAGPGRPAAVRGGGDGRGPEGGGRAGRPRSAPRPPGSHATPPGAAPGPPAAGAEDGDDDDVQNPGPRRPRAHHLPLTAERDRTGRRGARRVPSVSATLSSPHPVAVVVVAAAVELGPPRFRWAITLFHTRPTHSGNGSERPLSAQALREGQGARPSPSSSRGLATPHCAGARPRQ